MTQWYHVWYLVSRDYDIIVMWYHSFYVILVYQSIWYHIHYDIVVSAISKRHVCNIIDTMISYTYVSYNTSHIMDAGACPAHSGSLNSGLDSSHYSTITNVQPTIHCRQQSISASTLLAASKNSAMLSWLLDLALLGSCPVLIPLLPGLRIQVEKLY
jgi:hypothetical protein